MRRIFDFTQAIVRTPGESVVHGLRAGDRPDPSLAGIRAEHAAYVAALRGAGLAVTVLDPLEAHPDALFVEDPALVFPEAAILLRPGAPSRAAEADHLRPALTDKFAQVLELGEGHADGGDVLTMPDCVWIGLSDRTNRAGAEALIALLARLGRPARIADTPPGVLHLKTACSLIDGETVLATRALAESGLFARYRVLVVPEGEEGGANVLRVRDVLLTNARFGRVNDLLGDCGARLMPLETGEIARIDAGLTCMSLRW